MSAENNNTSSAVWKVLILDSRSSVHQATKLLLQKLSFAGKSFMALSSFSLQEAKEMLQRDSDIAIVLMDAEINEENIGLNLVHFIRKELQNEKIRIVLRTGYPDLLPEKEIIKKVKNYIEFNQTLAFFNKRLQIFIIC